jgi:multidrug transporter EmrE-like cation transporter
MGRNASDSEYVSTPAGRALGVMLFLLAGSAMFCVGGAFMKPSHGFTELMPSLIVAASFVLGSVCLSRAMSGRMLSTTFILGLGIEALGAVALGVLVLGEKLNMSQAGGIALVLSGVALLRA